MTKAERKIGIIGLGYVGLPVALAFGRKFPGTVGFDISEKRVAKLRAGRDETREVETAELKHSGVTFTSIESDLKGCDFYVVAVPTPINEDKRPDLRALVSASESVGRTMSKGAIIVYESTVYPGVTEEVCGPVLERVSGMKCGVDFKLGYSPERINPGDREHTIETVIKVVSGQDQETLETIAEVYGKVVRAGVFKTSSIKVAEAAKVIENTQRDLNIALMNELAIIFDRMSISTKDVLDAAGTKWNFQRFSPGLVGGHCIGVDPYYLTAKAEQLGYLPQVILAGRRINDGMGQFIAQRMVKFMINGGVPMKGSRVGIFGVTFKENVPDIRNSRVPSIIAELKEFGIEVLVHDPLAVSEEVREEYGFDLVSWDALKNLDGVIYAVSHRTFVEKPAADLFSVLKKNGVFVDVKSALNRSEVPSGYIYWQV